MAGSIRVEIDSRQVAAVQELIKDIKGGATRAMANALNRTVDRAATVANQEIRKQVNLKASYVRSRLYKRRAGAAALSAALWAERRGLLLSHFSLDLSPDAPIVPPELRAGGVERKRVWIWLKVKPGASKVALVGKNWPRWSDPFYVRLKNSNRIGIAQRRPGRKLEVLHGPSLSQVFTTVKDDISEGLSEFLAQRLDHEAQFILDKHKK